jgi:ribosomal protein S18 acetylase RimI-like enzyme
LVLESRRKWSGAGSGESPSVAAEKNFASLLRAEVMHRHSAKKARPLPASPKPNGGRATLPPKQLDGRPFHRHGSTWKRAPSRRAPWHPNAGLSSGKVSVQQGGQFKGITPLGRDLMDRAINTLERAFSTDPMFTWIFPNPDRRSRSLRALVRVPLEYGLRYGRVTQSNDAMSVAIWIPPGRKVTTGGMVRCGILTVPFRIGLRPFMRFAGANDVMGRLHENYVPEPHWYLLIVGVDPDRQGRALGSALLKEGLARADQTNSPCYLETSEERNLAFYERQGFAVVGSAALGDGGPRGWAMRRERRRPS